MDQGFFTEIGLVSLKRTNGKFMKLNAVDYKKMKKSFTLVIIIL